MIAELGRSCGDTLLDVHTDPDHHRTVFTFAGAPQEVAEAAQALARTAVARIQLAGHDGAHPRMGALDVVPFVALGETPGTWAVDARDAFCAWAASHLDLPCFRYGILPDGSERTLPDVRRGAFARLSPDAGPPRPHPTAGAVAVGARPVLVAYNLWLEGPGASGSLAHFLARCLRGPAVRALGFELARGVQVSCNLIDPATVGPSEVYDEVRRRLEGTEAAISRAELVGLAPASALARIPPERWAELDLSVDRTIEARVATAAVP